MGKLFGTDGLHPAAANETLDTKLAYRPIGQAAAISLQDSRAETNRRHR